MAIPLAYQKIIDEGRVLLSNWQSRRLVQSVSDFSKASSDVSAVIYHFGYPENIDAQFPAIKVSLMETWRHCGLMPTTIVTNCVTDSLEAFAETYSPKVNIVINKDLIPGDVESMSLDCNANLYKYFDTKYGLIVQNDGFPLQTGFEKFLGKYDYIGAPFVRHNFITNLTGLSRNYAVGNGGFSLRSKEICEQASYFWNKRYSSWFSKKSRFTKEDAFYCCVLPILEPSYRKAMRFAPIDEALSFSFDALYDREPSELPFGFHGPAAFRFFVQKGWIKDS